ncbi:MAG: HTTM domain-containing protein [Fuerstiella sp.]|nr:HTTM domain-containing protein [Fuerstiella sp.]
MTSKRHNPTDPGSPAQIAMTSPPPTPIRQRVSMQQWCRALFKPVDNGWLVYFRILFGIEMLWTVWKHYVGIRLAWNIHNPFLFKYYGFDWVQTLPGNGMWILLGVLGVLSVFIIVGLLYRLSMFLFFLGFSYLFLLNQINYLNHFYLVCLLALVMTFLPAHQSLSLDALIRPRIRSKVAPAWSLWLLRIQVAIPYFYGGIAKINQDWLHGEPMYLWLSEKAHRFPGAISEFFITWEAAILFSYGGLLYDLLVIPMILWRRTRLLAYAITIFFHMTNTQLFSIGIFPWLMMLATLVYFPIDVPRRLLSRFTQVRPAGIIDSAVTTLGTRQKSVIAILAIYLGLQCLIPFRHHLYPGNVNWTEEGHRFSWHMMLRTKRGVARFFAHEPATGRSLEIDPGGYLHDRQIQKFAGKPRMIQQFAKFLAANTGLQNELRRRGLTGRIEIRVDGWVSINGRRPQRLIDPQVDLAQQPYDMWPAPWIVPLTEPLPERPWGINLKGWGEFLKNNPRIYKTDWESQTDEPISTDDV